jgi:hypothetical protein
VENHRFIVSLKEQYNKQQQLNNNNNQTNLIRKNLHCFMCGFFDAFGLNPIIQEVNFGFFTSVVIFSQSSFAA